MTQEDKNLLLKDLCARLLYWPNVKTVDGDDAYIVGLDDTEEGLFYVHILEDGDSYDTTMPVENFKPYLRPMSSMTEEEKKELGKLGVSYDGAFHNDIYDIGISMEEAFTAVSWFLERHFDINYIIEKGLALEAPKGMYKTE